MILPNLSTYGRQNASAGYAVDDEARSVPFSAVYDVATLQTVYGHRLLTDSPNVFRSSKNMKVQNVGLKATQLAALKARLATWQVVKMDCAFLSLTFKEHEPAALRYWELEEALRPVDFLQSLAQDTVRTIKSRCKTPTYVALHWRIEEDWRAHCSRWKFLSPNNWNCDYNSDNIAQFLKIEGVQPGSALYIATDMSAAELQTHPAFKELSDTYCVVTKSSSSSVILERELRALVEFEVCRASSFFFGNSVSSFAALLHLRRRLQRQPELHYNGGQIPLENFVPLPLDSKRSLERPLKWIFAFSSQRLSSSYVLDAQVAVRSAMANTRLVPIALVYGQPTPLTHWLEEQKVVVIFHSPKWLETSKHLVDAGYGARFSPNYLSHDAIVATFLRIDISQLAFSDTYVLYADIDVIFRNPVELSLFELLPEYFGIAPEFNKASRMGENMGVMLMNLVSLRKTYEALYNASFFMPELYASNEYGPLDQGAFRFTYSGRFHRLDPRWNWKPYWDENAAAPIMHFHGAKYADYKVRFHGCS